VRVDQAGQHEHARGVKHLGVPGRGETLTDRDDLPVLDPQITVAQAPVGTEDLAVAYKQCIGHRYLTPNRDRTYSGVATSRPAAWTSSTARRTNWAFDSAS
jgi:hypothetical protein